MAGYGGQEIALDVNDTPLDISSPLQKVAAIQSQQSENQYRGALTSSLQHATAEKAQLFPSQLQTTQNAAALNTAATQRDQISRAMATVDPHDSDASEKWDAAMRKLAANGVTDAEQYIGRYSPDRQERLTAAYSADNAMSALAGIGMSSTPDAQFTPEQKTALDTRFSGWTSDQLKTSYDHFEKIKDALNQVANSANPAQTWAQLAPQFGHNEPFSWQAYKSAWNQIGPMDTYLRGRIQEAQAGLSAPVLPSQIVKGANGENVRVDTAGNVTPITAAQGKWSTNAAGIETNSLTGETRDANGATTGPVGPVYDQIGSAAIAQGASAQRAQELRQLTAVESGGTPGQTSATGRKGLLQLSDATFSRFAPGGDINNPNDQVKAGLGAWDEAHRLAAAAGGDTPQNAYVAYQQGPGGGPALLKAAQTTPDAKAVDVLAPFYDDRKTALQAITKNGGDPNMTAAQFVQHIQGQWDAKSGGPQTGAADGVQFPRGYDEDTFRNMFWEQALSGKEPSFTRGPGGQAGIAQAAYRKWSSNFMRINDISPSDLKDTASKAKAIGAAQSKMTGMQALVNTSEGTVDNSIGILTNLIDKGGSGPTGLPVLNRWIQGGRKAIGDPDVVQFDNALHLVANEYTKVMTTTNGMGGVTSDRAREEAQSLLNGNYNAAQLKGALTLIQQEMSGRSRSIQTNLDSLSQGMSQLTPRAGDATHAAGAPSHDMPNYPGNPTAPSSQWKGYTNGQLWRAQQFRGSKDAEGTQGNPVVAASAAAVKARIAQANPTADNPFYYVDPHGTVLHYP